MKRLALLLLLVLVPSACRDSSPVTPAVPGSPLGAISDGSLGSGHNAHFFFLPPMVPDPAVSGTFNPTIAPDVRVCELDPAGDRPIADDPCLVNGYSVEFSGTAVEVSTLDQHYKANWDTKVGVNGKFTTPGNFYRISIHVVLADGTDLVLGFADVQIADNGGAAKKVDGDLIGLADGRTLPIRFRIEEGALAEALKLTNENGECDCGVAVVGQEADTVFTDTNWAVAFFPAGAIPDPPGEVTVLIRRVTFTSSSQCFPTAASDLEQVEGCYTFDTYPFLENGFDLDVTVGVCIRDELLETPLGEQYDLYSYSPGRTPPGPVKLAAAPTPSSIQPDCAGFDDSLFDPPVTIGFGASPLGRFASASWEAVLQPMLGFFSPRELIASDGGTMTRLTRNFSNIGWARTLILATNAGDGQSAVVGTAVPINPSVLVTSGHHDHTGDGVADPQAVSGVEVTFTVTGGGGSLIDPSTEATATEVKVSTDTGGIASIVWTLGPTAGTPQELTASVPGGHTVTFTANATDVILSLFSVQNGWTEIWEVDPESNPAADVIVYSFDGFDTPTAMATDPSSGVVYVWNELEDGLLSVDPCFAGSETLISDAEPDPEMESLAYDAVNSILYGANDTLFTIDVVTGEPTEAGAPVLPGGGEILGMEMVGSTLYGVGIPGCVECIQVPSILEIDPATGQVKRDAAGAAILYPLLTQDAEPVGTTYSIVHDASNSKLIGGAEVTTSSSVLFDIPLPLTPDASGNIVVTNVRPVAADDLLRIPSGMEFAPACPVIL